MDNLVLKELHLRRIHLRAYERIDGLYEVIGRLMDTKSDPFHTPLADKALPPGEALHDIEVRLVISAEMVVNDASADMRITPFGICRGATEALQRLKGLRIGTGWNKKVRELLGGAASCTHIVELLGPMATTFYQAMAPSRHAALNSTSSTSERKAKVDSCYGYSAEREVVARLWPELHSERKS